MKKILFLFLFAGTSCFAQSTISKNIEVKQKLAFYLKAGLGYGFAKAGALYGVWGPWSGSTTYAADGSVSQYQYDKVSFGKGMFAQVGAGMMFGKHAGVEIDVNMSITKPSYTWKAYNVVTVAGPVNSSNTFHAKAFSFVVPAIVLQTDTKTLNVYTRVGLVLPINTRITREREVDYQSSSDKINYVTEGKSKFSVGYSMALGLSCKISKGTTLWFEFSELSLTTYIDYDELKSYNQNGVNVPLSSFSTTKIPYALSGSASSSSNPNATDAVPFNNVGINAGLKFDL